MNDGRIRVQVGLVALILTADAEKKLPKKYILFELSALGFELSRLISQPAIY